MADDGSLLGIDWQSNLSAIVEETNFNLRRHAKQRLQTFEPRASLDSENHRPAAINSSLIKQIIQATVVYIVNINAAIGH